MKPYRHEPIKTRTTAPKELRIDLRPAEELKPNPANARIHSKKQIRQIANSIEAFGFNVPVLVDAELNVICGHGRLLACRELGWTEVPTLCLDHLSPVQACTLNDHPAFSASAPTSNHNPGNRARSGLAGGGSRIPTLGPAENAGRPCRWFTFAPTISFGG